MSLDNSVIDQPGRKTGLEEIWQRQLEDGRRRQPAYLVQSYIQEKDYAAALVRIKSPELPWTYGQLRGFVRVLYEPVPKRGEVRSNLTLPQLKVLKALGEFFEGDGIKLELDEVVLQYCARLQPDGRWRSRGNDYKMYRLYVPDFFRKEEWRGRFAYRKAVQEAKSAVVSRVKGLLLDGADSASLPQANYQPRELKRDKAVKIKVTLGELVAKQ